MKYTSIFEKLGCLGNLITSSIIYPVFLIILLLLAILLVTKFIKRKKVIVLMMISYLVLFIITILTNYKALSKVFDSISTNLFTNIYFPSTYTYLFISLVIDIVTIVSILDVKTEKIYKFVNGLCFFVSKFLLALIMETVAKNNIDIFSKKSLFANINLVILLESSINIFIIWLLALTVIYITSKVTERIIIKNTDKELEDKSTNISNELVAIDETNWQEDYLNDERNKQPDFKDKVSVIENHNTINNSFSLDDLTIPNTNEIINNITKPATNQNIDIKDNVTDSDLLLDKLLNNGLPLIRDDVTNEIVKESKPINLERETDKNSYTLNDYRIFNKILKDIRENNNSNVISIDRSLELKLLMKYSAEEYSLFKGMLKNYSN